MITKKDLKEWIKNFLEESELGNDITKIFNEHKDDLLYSDILDFHRELIESLWLSFRIWQVIENQDSSKTIYYFECWNKIIELWKFELEIESEDKLIEMYLSFESIMEKSNLIMDTLLEAGINY